MAALTAKQIADINGSDEASRLSGMGTLLGTLSSDRVVSGSVVPTSQRFPVATGLTSVKRAMVSFSGSPVPVNHLWSYAVSGSVAGDILLYQYGISTSASIALPVVSTGSSVDAFAQVTWIAIGS